MYGWCMGSTPGTDERINGWIDGWTGLDRLMEEMKEKRRCLLCVDVDERYERGYAKDLSYSLGNQRRRCDG